MIYKFTLISSDNHRYRFFGKKIIKADRFGETGLTDTTTLFVEIFSDDNESSQIIASGVLKIGFKDFSQQLSSMEVINTESDLVRLEWTSKFGKFFAETLWHVYSGLAECKYLDPRSPPRKKRPLRLGNAVPIMYKVLTEDDVSLLFYTILQLITCNYK